MNTSMELLNDRLTLASMVTVSPSRMGRSNDTLLTAAVTTTLRQCRLALMAEADVHPVQQLSPHEVAQDVGVVGQNNVGGGRESLLCGAGLWGHDGALVHCKGRK